MRVDLQVTSSAPRGVVWSTLVDWERQCDWMLDARAVHVLTPQREGVGVTIRCPTNLLGVTVQDIMRVTRWVEGEVLEVVHLGRVITGSGAFELQDAPDGGTVIRWWEEVDPPLGRVGAIGARFVVAPVTKAIFARSLKALARTAEDRASANGNWATGG